MVLANQNKELLTTFLVRLIAEPYLKVNTFKTCQNKWQAYLKLVWGLNTFKTSVSISNENCANSGPTVIMFQCNFNI